MNINRARFMSHSLAPAVLLAAAIVAFSPQAAVAQGLPTTFRGDAGLKSGSQAPPGFYLTNLIYNYNFDTLKANDGRKVTGGGSINQAVYLLAFTYVSEKKVLGANYSASYALPLANIAVDFPRLDQLTGWSASDVYFQPIQLGWHFKQADLVAGYGLAAPTGRFSPGAGNNTGLGQWTHELTFGFTVYPNEKKSIHLATLASYDIQSEKRGTDQKVGNTLTLEGGAGAAFLKGLANAGLAYYAQWKMTEDRNVSLAPAFRGKHRYLGLGPEFNTVLPISRKTPVFATFRYLFETGNRVATQGDTLFFGVTVVIPPKK